MRPSAENLIKRVLAGKPLPTVCSVVDLYLVVQLQHLLPIGGYDCSALCGDITLGTARMGEMFIGIGEERIEHTFEGEIVYRDSTSVLTRCWNYRDADRSKILSQSKDVVLMLEAPYATIPTDALVNAGNTLASYLQAYCHATCSVSVLNVADKSVLSLDSS